ncbi:hypothetical protein PIB30_076293 [Stylosanthes scabra]|uniref:Disease resistance RPP13-like protein 1 n=1 Tax=Stylosanthes scabra TaxID=79078 RepID=A0ABU6XQ66_9FABA|nr:hypothetical protein [Stylosanthes scabra]
MAAKFDGGAYLSSFLDVVLENLSSILEEDDSCLERNKLLERLQNYLYEVEPVLDDAELKQFTNKRVKKWLVDLQDALYSADDYLDELSTNAAIDATQKGPGSSSSDSWSRVVDSYIKDTRNLEHIVRRLEAVVARKDSLRLKEGAKVDMSWRIPSTSLVLSSDIFGRDKDKEKVIKLLLDDTRDAESPVAVIPIWGMGGVGKTTLAQLVYSDAKVVKKFNTRAWVCVAEYFDPVGLTRTILQKISPASSLNKDDFDSLQTRLKEALTGKTFSLVLDDVWHDQKDTWEHLLKPFQYGNHGIQGLGGLLRGNSDVKSWNRILKIETWEFSDDMIKVVPALRISYYYLPSCLKKCFVYCSLFPKDYEFDKGDLILLRMAENFLQPVEKKTPEEVGDEYFDELVARSFFQPHSTREKIFVMHDLVHDLAMIFAREFCSRAEEHEKAIDIETNIVTLPESLGSLYNLQTLKLYGCFELKMLPVSMQDLVNLRHHIRETELNKMPIGMSKLKSLQFLSDYVVGKNEGNKIKELGALANLQQSICISNLENVVSNNEASEERMSDKDGIDLLELYWSWNKDENIVDFQIENDILDKLQPHSNLKHLEIWGYKGITFPDWLGRSSHHNITKVTLGYCRNCRTLPSLGQKWHSLEFNTFPRLRELSMRDCPMLRGDLPNHLPSLQSLQIWNCEQLSCSLPIAPAVTELNIVGDNKVTSEELSPLLRSLVIVGKHLVESAVEAIKQAQLSCLTCLSISHCSSHILFPVSAIPPITRQVPDSELQKIGIPNGWPTSLAAGIINRWSVLWCQALFHVSVI